MVRINIKLPGIFFHFVPLLLCSMVLVGCASVKLPPPSASAEAVQTLRLAKLSPASVGKFSLADGKDPDMDKEVGGLRGSSLSATSGSFSQQLKDELIVALQSAALYDPKSSVRIEGRLTDSMVDAAIKIGKARLAADFTVKHDNRRVYHRALTVESQWPSSFVGAVALPKAINEYGSLYKKLLNKLFTDKKFQAVLRHR